jgi:mono/diheme cytochrome c family protein
MNPQEISFDMENKQADYLIKKRSNMKKCARYIIVAMSLFLSLSLIVDAFADDDHYRKRNRYRGGSQKVEDDNDGHLMPVANQAYQETCAGCHFAYQPGLFPSGSWLKILNQLDDHFGKEVEADPDTIKSISEYLQTNAAENSPAKLSARIMRSLGNQVPMRITDIPYIRREHRKLNPAVFELESVGSPANCVACHTTAEKGIYDDDNVKIPR